MKRQIFRTRASRATLIATALLLAAQLVSAQLPCNGATTMVSELIAESDTPILGRTSTSNGDFFITGDVYNSAGNGVNETTMWMHSFIRIPGYKPWQRGRIAVNKALLRLDLTAAQGGGNDELIIPGIGKTRVQHKMQPGERGFVNINLTSEFDRAEFFAEIFDRRGGRGHIAMIFRDDALIHSARLELIPLCTP